MNAKGECQAKENLTLNPKILPNLAAVVHHIHVLSSVSTAHDYPTITIIVHVFSLLFLDAKVYECPEASEFSGQTKTINGETYTFGKNVYSSRRVR